MLADLVVPLTYADYDVTTQLRRDIRIYKNGATLDVRGVALHRLSALTWHFFHFHSRCLDALGIPVTDYVTVPSGKPGSREGDHPLEGLARFAPESWKRLDLERTRDARSRSLDSKSLSLTAAPDLSGRHVVVFDDTWTTGASAQSAAKVVRQAGAEIVSIVVVARIMNSASWEPTATFFKKYPKTEWSGAVCPVTGGACP
jgi:hypothetical protein